jgi:hypothetical protein
MAAGLQRMELRFDQTLLQSYVNVMHADGYYRLAYRPLKEVGLKGIVN